MTVATIIQARMGSTRLPGKTLMDIAGEPLLAHMVARSDAMERSDLTVVATSTDAGDDPIAALGSARGWHVFRGSEADVLDRYVQAARDCGADHVIRVTADTPLMDPEEGDRVIAHHLESGADYTHNITVWGGETPLGCGVEAFTLGALEASWQDGHEPHHREHVDEFVYEHPERFKLEKVVASEAVRRPDLRLTVDTPEDLQLIREIYERLYQPGGIVALRDAIKLLDAHPELLELNRHVQQKTI
jgi:spore coat polysaccharide biosynthesis protein SpsF (cytidylyltransferase family)